MGDVMAHGKPNPELAEQVRDAFNTIILNESFLSDEEKQLELLAKLRELTEKTFKNVDRRLARDEEEVERLRERH
jgi:hypothetical protein